jgi:hypothetical protein
VKSMRTEALPKFRSHIADIDAWALPSACRMRSWVREVLCGIHGHDLLLHFDRGRRICLRCVTCGHETLGWSTK